MTDIVLKGDDGGEITLVESPEQGINLEGGLRGESVKGDPGPPGSAPSGGTERQVLGKNSDDEGDVGWLTLTKEDVELGNVPNVNATQRSNHTGTQLASTISDFQAQVSGNDDVAANTSARHVHSNKTILDNTTESYTSADKTKVDNAVSKNGDTMGGPLGFTGTGHAGVKLNSLTTAQRDALTAANGMIIYNTTTNKVQKYENGAWSDVGSGGGGAVEALVAGDGIEIDDTDPVNPVVTAVPGLIHTPPNYPMGINVGNDQTTPGSTYKTAQNIADLAILNVKLAQKRVRIALPSWDSADGITNMRALALLYKGAGYFVSYGITGNSAVQNSTTYASWLSQVNTEAAWANTNGIDRFYIGNEEDWQAQIGAFGTVTAAQVRADVLAKATTLKALYPSMEIVYSSAQGTIAQWGAEDVDGSDLDKLGFNMYDTLGSFEANIVYFMSQVGAKFFISEWASNYGYQEMITTQGYSDEDYRSDLSQRYYIIASHGVEAYMFALRYGDNTRTVGNWNILDDSDDFVPGGADAAFGLYRGTPSYLQKAGDEMAGNLGLNFHTLRFAAYGDDAQQIEYDEGIDGLAYYSWLKQQFHIASNGTIPLELDADGVHANATLDMHSNRIQNLLDPTSAQHAATKAYVDNLIQGIKAKTAVRVATTTNGTLASAFANGQTVDGVTLATGDRILLKNQTTASQNGIYTVNASGAPTRATDADSGTELSGMFVFVMEGTTNADTGWLCTNDGTITLGTTALTFVQFSQAGVITAGTGLTKTGNSIAISDPELLALAGLTSAADALPYFTGSGTASLTTLSSFIRGLLDDADATTARTTLGLGTVATQAATNVALTGGSISGVRVSPRSNTITSSATITPTSDASDQYNVTAQAAPATIAAPSGTPTSGQRLVLKIKDDGTARALTWNAIYRAIGVTLPTTTVAGKWLYVGMIYANADTKWDVVAVQQEA